MEKTNLHVHTTFSDGIYPPEQIVKMSSGKLRAIAITDHDETSGIRKALEVSEKYGVEVIPGIECNCSFHRMSIEILGYFINYESDEIQEFVKEQRKGRERQVLSYLKQYNAEFPDKQITFKEVVEKAKGMIGRPHLAFLMVERGVVSTFDEAFDKYLGDRGKFKKEIKSSKRKARDVIKMILDNRGLPVLSHPIIYEWNKYKGAPEVEEVIAELWHYGLKGIEVYHPEQNEEKIKQYTQIANEYELLITGGSDFHGIAEKPWDKNIEDYTVPYELLEKMKKKSKELLK